MADTWDDQYTRVTPAVASGSTRISKNVVVPDDWEDEEEEEEDPDCPVDVPNKQLWENANANVHHPMPALIISRGTSSTSVALPSLPLNQPPPMRILKRPSPPSPSTASSNSSNVNGETLKEREARYHAARERIFGASPDLEPQENDDNIKPIRKAVSPPPSPVREPRGNEGSDFNTKDFGEPKAKSPAITISRPKENSSS